MFKHCLTPVKLENQEMRVDCGHLYFVPFPQCYGCEARARTPGIGSCFGLGLLCHCAPSGAAAVVALVTVTLTTRG